MTYEEAVEAVIAAKFTPHTEDEDNHYFERGSLFLTRWNDQGIEAFALVLEDATTVLAEAPTLPELLTTTIPDMVVTVAQALGIKIPDTTTP